MSKFTEGVIIGGIWFFIYISTKIAMALENIRDNMDK